MKTVRGKTFTGQRVVLDGKSFVECHFKDASLIIEGNGLFEMQNCKIEEDCRLAVEGPGQVLLHVLTNAVRFSPPGSQVDVCITSQGDRVEILVADRGIEIPPGDGQRIYLPFERGSNAREAGVRGLGLGLYLARGELAHADGTIQHEPRDGGGTVFRITVPAA